MSTEIDVSEFGSEIGKLLDGAKVNLNKAIEDGLDEAVEILIDALTATSPKRTGEYAGNWGLKYPRGRYTRHRYIHNLKAVPYQGRKVSLAAFIEYAFHGRPHIKKTVNAKKGEIQTVIEKRLKQMEG